MKKDSAKFKTHLRRIGAKGGKAGGEVKVRGSKEYYSKIAKARWARERKAKNAKGSGTAVPVAGQPAKKAATRRAGKRARAVASTED